MRSRRPPRTTTSSLWHNWIRSVADEARGGGPKNLACGGLGSAGHRADLRRGFAEPRSVLAIPFALFDCIGRRESGIHVAVAARISRRALAAIARDTA